MFRTIVKIIRNPITISIKKEKSKLTKLKNAFFLNIPLNMHVINIAPNSHDLMVNAIDVRKVAKIRNRYNQVPHMTKDTAWESDKNIIKHLK